MTFFIITAVNASDLTCLINDSLKPETNAIFNNDHCFQADASRTEWEVLESGYEHGVHRQRLGAGCAEQW
jgi:hypothetical protein